MGCAILSLSTRVGGGGKLNMVVVRVRVRIRMRLKVESARTGPKDKTQPAAPNAQVTVMMEVG
jgi:hypothetical protein